MNNVNNAKINYDAEMQKIAENPQHGRKLLLHVCCAPCASYTLECLSPHFDITLFYYNPNIYPEEEYTKRLENIYILLKRMNIESIPVIAPQYDHEEFTDFTRGLEDEPEGGSRCLKCFDLRLFKTAEYAKEGQFDWFCTTLTISPHKNARIINETGMKYSRITGVPWLPSDFKKREGFKRSTVICRNLDIYRQNYCGCTAPQPHEFF